MRMTPPEVRAEKVCLAKNQPYVSLLTFGGLMQPILVLCGKHEAAAAFGVEVE